MGVLLGGLGWASESPEFLEVGGNKLSVTEHFFLSLPLVDNIVEKNKSEPSYKLFVLHLLLTSLVV